MVQYLKKRVIHQRTIKIETVGRRSRRSLSFSLQVFHLLIDLFQPFHPIGILKGFVCRELPSDSMTKLLIIPVQMPEEDREGFRRRR